MNQLKSVTLHITNKCSHECSFCYYRSKPNASATEKSNGEPFVLNNLKAIIDELVKNQVEDVVLLGGDPAEYSHFVELVKYIHHKNIRITSVSNTHQYASEPTEIVKYLSMCETTIHGTKEFHDNTCGSIGAYESVLGRLKEIKQLGCSTGITINITPSNVNMLYETVEDIFKHYGRIIDYINIQRIVPQGRATINDSHYLTKKNLLEAFIQIEKIHLIYGIDIQCEDGFPLCVVPKKYWKYIHRCEWGYEKLSINGNGGISRCGADPRYNLGNILQTPLETIWQNSSLLNEFRRKEFLPQRCQECNNLNICGGGCVIGKWAGKEFSPDILLSN